MNIIFKIITSVLVLVAIIVPIIKKHIDEEYAEAYDSSHTKRKKRNVVIPIVVTVALFIFSWSFTIIPTGYTGVRTTFGQIDNVTVQNGFNWQIPFIQSIKQVNNKQQDIVFSDEQIWSETSTRTAIYYEGITLTYQINPEKSAWIYANVSDYKSSLVSKDILASAIKSSSKSLNDEDATNRSIIEPLVVENLQKALDEKYGENVVYVNKITISNADFEDSYNEAIAAEQQAIENQKAVDKAETDAQVTKTKAEAEAEAKLVEAEAEAKANKMLEESLNDNILRDKYIDKWNGELPQVVSDEASSVLIPSSDTTK